MNVLIVFHSLYSLAGGVDNRISQLELELSKKVKTNFLLFNNNIDLPHSGEITVIDSINIPGFILRNKIKFKIISYIYGFISLIYRIYKMRKLLKKSNYQTIIAIDDYFSIITILASLGLNKKIICSVRNNWNKLYNHSMIHLLPDFIYKKILPILMNRYAYKVHCVSEELSDILKKEYKVNNTITIYNLFDISKIKSLAKQETNFDFEYFINIGHFNEQKNQKDLILMYKDLKEKFNIKEKLVLIGDGILLENCKDLAKKLKIEDSVILLGKKSNPYKYLSKAKLYISTSLYEGLPAVLVESLILNIPIVSYNFKTGSKELCLNLTKQNPYVLSQKVSEVLSNKNKIVESKKFAENLINKKFDNRVILDKWLGIL